MNISEPKRRIEKFDDYDDDDDDNDDDNNDNNNTLQQHHRESPELYRLERRAYRSMTISHDLHSTASTIHKGYYPQHITESFKIY